MHSSSVITLRKLEFIYIYIYSIIASFRQSPWSAQTMRVQRSCNDKMSRVEAEARTCDVLHVSNPVTTLYMTLTLYKLRH